MARATDKQIAFIGNLTDKGRQQVFELLAQEHGFFNATAAKERATVEQASHTIDRLLQQDRAT